MFSNGHPSRSRLDRIANFELAPNRLAQAWQKVSRGDVVLRLSAVVLAAMFLMIMDQAWNPPFNVRFGQVPSRNIVAAVSFEKKDVVKTREKRHRAAQAAECVYNHDPKLIEELRTALKGRLLRLMEAQSEDEVREVWDEFSFDFADPNVKPAADPNSKTRNSAVSAESPDDLVVRESSDQPQDAATVSIRTLDDLRRVFVNDVELAELERQLVRAFEDVERYGVLDDLQHDIDEGSYTEVTVVRISDGKAMPRVRVDQVRFADVIHRLRTRLELEISPPALANAVFQWVRQRMPRTLVLDPEATRKSTDAARASVPDVMTQFEAGSSQLAIAGEPLDNEDVKLLSLEHKARIRQATWGELLLRAAAAAGMYCAVFILCGTYLYYRERILLRDWRRFLTLLSLCVAIVLAAQACSVDPWQIELLPLMMFGFMVGIAYRNEVAFLLIAVVSLLVTLTLGKPINDFVIYAATLASTVFLLAHVRSRTKLIYVGAWAALVAIFTTAGVWSVSDRTMDASLVRLALWQGALSLLAAMLMTALLPFVELLMDVQTDLSLLELGDVAHPLLQELAQRAPGTYNHSISVASIAQTAAEIIGANGLLVRVGAYFHDIGKMLKPQYFVENQEAGNNRHDTLLPAMSTLIIIAHVKDGADLARQHHLPRIVIDFILQHHGTTLVEYFYDRANRRSESNPDVGGVAEHSYRYPGPKPQSKETAVLMLADAAESATRSLSDPAPSRIENIVESIARKRLLDGQFDECGLTLQELQSVERSIIKSLIATHHGRVRYAEPQPA